MHVSKFDLIMTIETSCMAFMDETNLRVNMNQVIDLNSNVNKINEARRMSFMDEAKLIVSVPSSD